MGYGYGGYALGIDDAGGLFLTRVGIDNVTIPNLITDTNWHHVAVTKSGTSVVFYVDGLAYPAPSPYTSVFNFDTDIAIGARGDTLANSFLGSIDELSVYNRALSQSEIQAIYNAGSGGKCFTPVAPVITSQPTNETVFIGQSAGFSIVAAGTAPFSYQWSFNTTNIVGATNATLTLTSVQLTNAGNYAVLVSNLVNSILSSNAVLTVNPLPACDPLPAGLVSWWRAEGDTTDSMGLNNGSAMGALAYGTGEVGQAFSLDGSSSYDFIPNSVSLNPPGSFSMDAWIYPAQDGDQKILSKWGDQGGYSDQRSYNLTTTPGLGVSFSFSDLANQENGAFQTFEVTGVLTLNAWNHVAATYDITTGIRCLYVNGTKVGSHTNVPADAVYVGTAPVTIGAWWQNTGSVQDYFQGLIDEVSLYGRTLSDSEIQAIYNAGSAGKCYSPAPVITTQPTNETAYVGQSANFSVTVGGTQPFSYQWRFNTTNIVGATNATLLIASAQLTNAGIYAVLVSNVVNSILSSNAFLTVNPPPPCDPPPVGLVSWWPGEGNATDAIGTNNGTLENEAGFTTGKVGQTFVFAGSGEAVQLGNPTDLQLQGFTIETWIQRGSASSSTPRPGANDGGIHGLRLWRLCFGDR
jgi:hypothetical protein